MQQLHVTFGKSRSAATDILNLQYVLLEKCGLAAIEVGFFCRKLIFWVTVYMKDKNPFIGLFICFCTTPKGRKSRLL